MTPFLTLNVDGKCKNSLCSVAANSVFYSVAMEIGNIVQKPTTITKYIKKPIQICVIVPVSCHRTVSQTGCKSLVKSAL